jgi:hypothetical protein
MVDLSSEIVKRQVRRRMQKVNFKELILILIIFKPELGKQMIMSMH